MPAILALAATKPALQVRQSTTTRFRSGKARVNPRMNVCECLSPLHDLGRGRLGSGQGDMLGLLHGLLLLVEASAVAIRTNSVPHLKVKLVKCFSEGLKKAIAQFIKCNCSGHAITPIAAESGSQGDGGAVEVCLCGLHWQAGAVASTGEQSLTRHRVSAGAGASLSLPQMRAHLPGVSAGSHARGIRSERVKGLAVMLYLLGLSYGAVSLALDSLGVPLSKTRVYEMVQAVAARVPGLKREQVFQGVKTKALGGDLTSVKCAGQWLHLGLTADSLSGLALTIDEVSAEDAETLKAWIEPIAQSVGAQVLVSDDADSFKSVADDLGLLHQVCKSHVKRNTEALIDDLRPLVAKDSDGSLHAIGVEPAQAVADLVRLGELISSRQPEQAAEVEQLHRR